MNIVERAAREAWKPRDTSPVWRWAEKNITVDKTSPFPGRFRSTTAPWTKAIMEDFGDNRIRRISVRCSAQSAKTQTMMICAAWAIAEDPGPMMWVMAAMDEAKTFTRTRLMPTFYQCPPVALKMPPARGDKSALEINFPEAPLVINGANSQSKLQSKPIRWLLLDEVRNYPPGALEMVLKRTTAFWNAREVLLSTADTESDAVDLAFKEGDQRFYHVPCPACEKKAPLEWKHLKWDENEVTRPGGVEWDFEQVKKTVRYECPHCGHRILDVIAVRRAMAERGEWVATNPRAPAESRSYTWNALLPWWIRWGVLVEEYLRALAALEVGGTEQLKSFINERLGEAWREQHIWANDVTPTQGFKLGDLWPEEFIRFMSVDVQQNHFWFVVRAWSKGGASRLVAEGRILTWADIEDVRQQFKVAPKCVVVDSGYNASDVYAECCKFGWVALKGEDREWFSHYENGLRMLRAHSEIIAGDPGLGTAMAGRQACPVLLWSNPTVKDLLARMKAGKGLPWEVPDGVSADYLAQMKSEAKVKVFDKWGHTHFVWQVIGKRPNHLWDCECMQLVCAIVEGLVPQAALVVKGGTEPTAEAR